MKKIYYIAAVVLGLVYGVSLDAQEKKECSFSDGLVVEAGAGGVIGWGRGIKNSPFDGGSLGRSLCMNTTIGAKKYFSDGDGHRGYGVGVSLSVPMKLRGTLYGASVASVDFICRGAQILSKHSIEKYEVNPLLFAGYAWSPAGGYAIAGVGGQLGVNIIDRWTILGQARLGATALDSVYDGVNTYPQGYALQLDATMCLRYNF